MSKFPSLFPLLILIFLQLAQPSHHRQISPQQPEQRQQQHHHQQQRQLTAQLSPPNQRSKRQSFDFSMNTPPPPVAPSNSTATTTTTNNNANTNTTDGGGAAGPGWSFGNLGSSIDPDNDGSSSVNLNDLLGLGSHAADGVGDVYKGDNHSRVNSSPSQDCWGDGMVICKHGYCVINTDPEGVESSNCICDAGWIGEYCDERCTRNCSNNGTCKVLTDFVKSDNGGGDGGSGEKSKKEVCVCPYPWVGSDCSEMPPEEDTDRSWLYWLGGSLGVGLLLLPVVAGLFLYYLWKKRMVFAMKFVFYFKPYEDNDGLQYDAFVSYVDSPQDNDFAHKILLPNLENGMGFKLCLQHRDFTVGGAISDNIIETLEDSRRFILVLTPRYLKCEWAQFEYLRAFHEMLKLKIRIVPIIVEEVTTEQADNPTLRTILESTHHIKYPGNHATQQEIDKFWKRVRLSMPKMKKQKEADDSFSKEMIGFGEPESAFCGALHGDMKNGIGAVKTDPASACKSNGVDNEGFVETAHVISETQPSSLPSLPIQACDRTADHCTKSPRKETNLFTQLLRPKAEKKAEPVQVEGFRPLGDMSLSSWCKQQAGTVECVDRTGDQEMLSKAVTDLEAKLESTDALPIA